jgi:hypothetical protein
MVLRVLQFIQILREAGQIIATHGEQQHLFRRGEDTPRTHLPTKVASALEQDIPLSSCGCEFRIYERATRAFSQSSSIWLMAAHFY